MVDSSTLLVISATCTPSTAQNGYILVISATAVPSGSTYLIKAYADNPTAACTTGVFTLKFYTTSVLTVR